AAIHAMVASGRPMLIPARCAAHRCVAQSVAGGSSACALFRAENHFIRSRACPIGPLSPTLGPTPSAPSVPPSAGRLLLSHVLLQEHKDLSAAEQSLRDVLALDPNHLQAKRNLTLLLQEVERAS